MSILMSITLKKFKCRPRTVPILSFHPCSSPYFTNSERFDYHGEGITYAPSLFPFLMFIPGMELFTVSRGASEKILTVSNRHDTVKYHHIFPFRLPNISTALSFKHLYSVPNIHFRFITIRTHQSYADFNMFSLPASRYFASQLRVNASRKHQGKEVARNA